MGIKTDLKKATDTNQISRLKRQAIKNLDEADSKVYPTNSYEEFKAAWIVFLPEDHPTSEGELLQLVNEAKERVRASCVIQTSVADMRARRILSTVNSDGKRTNRRFS